MALQQGFEGGKPLGDPVRVPTVLFLRPYVQHTLQVTKHAQVVERVDVGCDQLRHLQHPGTQQGVAGQQGRLRIARVEVVDDRQ
ncbi:hypothetical protein D3C71_1762080 [compost metagenome]